MDDFLATSSYVALWNCPTCHGKYQARIRDREAEDDSFPYCSDRKVLKGYNSFQVRHPDLMKTWEYVNNYILADPNIIGDNCNNKVWWFCEKNPKHKYIMSPRKRLYYQKRCIESCTYCKGYRRKKHHFM